MLIQMIRKYINVNYKATTKSGLNTHIQSLHERKTYPCQYCEYEATRKDRLYCGLSELWNNQSGNNQNWKNQNMSWSESSYLVLWWKVQTSQTQLIVWSLSWSWSRSWSWSLTSIFNIQCQELKRKCSDQLLFSGQFHQGFFSNICTLLLLLWVSFLLPVFAANASNLLVSSSCFSWSWDVVWSCCQVLNCTPQNSYWWKQFLLCERSWRLACRFL